MDLLQLEIARKKRQNEEKNPQGKKYVKRGDLIEQQRQEYFKRHRPKEEDVKTLIESKDKVPQEQEVDSMPALPRVEVIRRLRDRFEPILIFGETESESCSRLRRIEVNEPDNIQGIKNDYKEAMTKVEKVLDQQSALAGSSGTNNGGGKNSKNVPSEMDLYETEVTIDELQEMLGKADKGDMEADVQIVSEFIKFMMTKWAKNLDERNEEDKRSVMGKRETTIHAQTRTYLKPLLKMLKKQTLTDDVRDSLVKMIMFTLQREYIFAHEAYMEMAVGNAPWPIGVTNAGIHARPARENIFSKNVAHVLNDETQRKYIQGLKRLITKAQEYYPTDPSRSVDFVKKE